jgi:cob(I)alamin adenosyltransferase
MRIYTRTGDTGATGLIGGSRVRKNSARIAAIGDVDELNAYVGSIRAGDLDPDLDEVLKEVQNRLFDIGAELATPAQKECEIEIGHADIEALEASIDLLQAELPPLTEFILPGGTVTASHLHIARAVCRRAERSAAAMADSEEHALGPMAYLNRLSDWLFVAARTANHRRNVSDIAWSKRKP